MAWKEEEQPPAHPGPLTWKETMKLLLLLLSNLLVLALFVDSAVRTAATYNLNRPARHSVELVGARGIGPALAPGAEALAFKLLVHVDNGRIFGLRHGGGGGDVVVSYAGVPLARGRPPAFRVETKKAATVAVDTTSAGVGIPEDLLQLMSEERRRSSGVAQLQIDLWLDYGLFTCRVDLGGEQQRASKCQEQNYIHSS